MHAQLDSFTIMVVDDSATVRHAVDTCLTEHGMKVVGFEDGFVALANVVEIQPDLIFLDTDMPRLDGFQTCTLLKNNPRFHHVPVIMLSFNYSPFEQAKSRLAGAEDFVIKPFGQVELLHVIQQYLSSSVE
ncbi:MAG: response regulator [Acinetobacter sp.]